MGMHLAAFDLQVASILPIESIGLSVQKFKLDFQNGGHGVSVCVDVLLSSQPIRVSLSNHTFHWEGLVL